MWRVLVATTIKNFKTTFSWNVHSVTLHQVISTAMHMTYFIPLNDFVVDELASQSKCLGLLAHFKQQKCTTPKEESNMGMSKWLAPYGVQCLKIDLSRPQPAHSFIGRAEQRDVGLSVWYYYHHAALSKGIYIMNVNVCMWCYALFTLTYFSRNHKWTTNANSWNMHTNCISYYQFAHYKTLLSALIF